MHFNPTYLKCEIIYFCKFTTKLNLAKKIVGNTVSSGAVSKRRKDKKQSEASAASF